MIPVRFKIGTPAQNATYVGDSGSITIDSDSFRLHIHDGTTPGGTGISSNNDFQSIQSLLDSLGIEEVDGLSVALASKLAVSQIGAANGVLGLNSEGLVPTEQLPSFVEDVVIVPDYESLPETGEAGKLYIVDEFSIVYRWSISSQQYTPMSATISTSDDLSEGQVNLFFTEERLRDSFSGGGAISYDSVTGEFSIGNAVTSVNGETGAIVIDDKSDFGLVNVENYPVASETEAEEAALSTRYVTAERSRNFIEYMGFTESGGAWSFQDLPISSPSGGGGETLLAGNLNLGYYGEVAEGDLISQSDLNTAVGLSQGNFIDLSNTFRWLKFSHNNKTLFVAKRSIKSQVSWRDLYQLGLVYGIDGPGVTPAPSGEPINQLQTVTIGSDQYKVRLLKGFNNDPNNLAINQIVDHPTGVENSEWYNLILRVAAKSPFYDGAEYDGYPIGEWEQFTHSELNVGTLSDVGVGSWVQETPSSSGYRITMGRSDITSAVAPTDSYRHAVYGWRPVLELVE